MIDIEQKYKTITLRFEMMSVYGEPPMFGYLSGLLNPPETMNTKKRYLAVYGNPQIWVIAHWCHDTKNWISGENFMIMTPDAIKGWSLELPLLE